MKKAVFVLLLFVMALAANAQRFGDMGLDKIEESDFITVKEKEKLDNFKNSDRFRAIVYIIAQNLESEMKYAPELNTKEPLFRFRNSYSPIGDAFAVSIEISGDRKKIAKLTSMAYMILAFFNVTSIETRLENNYNGGFGNGSYKGTVTAHLFSNNINNAVEYFKRMSVRDVEFLRERFNLRM